MVTRRFVLVFLWCLLVAGCVGVPTGPAGSSGAGSTPTGVSTMDTHGTHSTPVSTADKPAYGTQFVSVERYEDQSRGASWPADERSTFENLTDDRQEVFLRAIEDGQQRFGPDERNPFDWHDEDRPQAVNYQDEWYYVRVAIV